MNSNEETIKRYFEAWKNQETKDLATIFTADARYIVRPFGLEEHIGLEAIKSYWENNTIAKLVDPKPYVITKLLVGDMAFLEWQCDYKNPYQESKEMRGMMVLEFQNGLIKELREHYEVRKL